ncbi:transketolase [Lysinibacillus capsici]|uniref:transketolase n=1 Tax=Lysinibacillus capsici TaxID=2115968 RepID=UPI0028BDA68F|nr:transketolase [Lysinibacillus capsici]WNN76928.1 transketolase [Lysinibacillus capsici]WPK06106.1 transketolase [Lysinibacillus capsici]
MINASLIEKLKKQASHMRINALKLANASGNNAAHVGPGLSIIEILAVLYGHTMNINSENLLDEGRDRFILSKEHGVLAYYTALYENGIITDEDLASFMKTGSAFLGHPVMNREKGIEFTSGSLGMGLSLAMGVAMGLKRKQLSNHVYVLLGDGESNEGSIWEGFLSAPHFKLDNLTVIIDRNGIQLGGKTNDILPMNHLEKVLEEIGWAVFTVNGHDIEALIDVFDSISNKPKLIIANTIKGKGVSFMEHNIDWHHAVLTDKLFTEAIEEQVREIE